MHTIWVCTAVYLEYGRAQTSQPMEMQQARRDATKPNSALVRYMQVGSILKLHAIEHVSDLVFQLIHCKMR